MAEVSGCTYSQDILQVFFLSTISRVLTYGCVCWQGNASKQDRDRLSVFESIYFNHPSQSNSVLHGAVSHLNINQYLLRNNILSVLKNDDTPSV